jgi:DNA-binding NarL/FixJ family response regulator
MELKVCALPKLKLTSADIGKLLCISERSVEGHRYHIRKKMRLAQAAISSRRSASFDAHGRLLLQTRTVPQGGSN